MFSFANLFYDIINLGNLPCNHVIVDKWLENKYKSFMHWHFEGS